MVGLEEIRLSVGLCEVGVDEPLVGEGYQDRGNRMAFVWAANTQGTAFRGKIDWGEFKYRFPLNVASNYADSVFGRQLSLEPRSMSSVTTLNCWTSLRAPEC
jgi:hypothetical protein